MSYENKKINLKDITYTEINPMCSNVKDQIVYYMLENYLRDDGIITHSKLSDSSEDKDEEGDLETPETSAVPDKRFGDNLINAIEETTCMKLDKDNFMISINNLVNEDRINESWEYIKNKNQELKRQEYNSQICFNEVCTENTSDDEGTPYCSKNKTHDCIFMMSEPPPNTLSREHAYNHKIPSHQEALNILSRHGLLQPDDYGEYNGTDFFRHAGASKLWFSFAKLIGYIFDLDWVDPMEKSRSIMMAKDYINWNYGIQNESELFHFEEDIRSFINYIIRHGNNVNSTSNLSTQELDDTIKQYSDEIIDKVRAIILTYKVKYEDQSNEP